MATCPAGLHQLQLINGQFIRQQKGGIYFRGVDATWYMIDRRLPTERDPFLPTKSLRETIQEAEEEEQAASYGGHDKVMQMLLDKGADVKMQGGFYGNALQAASSGGHDQGIRGCPHSPSARIGAQGTGLKLELYFRRRVPKMELEGRFKNRV